MQHFISFQLVYSNYDFWFLGTCGPPPHWAWKMTQKAGPDRVKRLKIHEVLLDLSAHRSENQKEYPGDFGGNAHRGTMWHSVQGFGGPFHSKITWAGAGPTERCNRKKCFYCLFIEMECILPRFPTYEIGSSLAEIVKTENTRISKLKLLLVQRSYPAIFFKFQETITSDLPLPKSKD